MREAERQRQQEITAQATEIDKGLPRVAELRRQRRDGC